MFIQRQRIMVRSSTKTKQNSAFNLNPMKPIAQSIPWQSKPFLCRNKSTFEKGGAKNQNHFEGFGEQSSLKKM
jgi:hypothetical protein